MTSLDLNADIGEGLPNDAALLDIVSSASIACGGHAGDEATIRAALRGAKARGWVVVAHPGFADPGHFGRRRLDVGADELTRQTSGREYFVTKLAFTHDVAPMFGPYLFAPTVRAVRALAGRLRALQSGHLNFYLGLIGLMLVIILAMALA